MTPEKAIRQAWNDVLTSGKQASPRGKKTRELVNYSFTIDEPWRFAFDITGRDMNKFIGCVEALQLIGQTSTPEIVKEKCKSLFLFTDEGVFDGAYGLRIHSQIGRLIEQLELDNDTRQAVINIYDSRIDLGRSSKDIPCTTTIQFMIRDERLCLRTNMRSNDAWLGLPYDVLQFTLLQSAVADALDIGMGWYHHSVGSFHVYEEHFAAMEKATMFVLETEQPIKCFSENNWSNATWESISSRARGILHLENVRHMSPLENYLFGAIHG